VPEAELPEWQGLYKSSLSKGVSAGHVAVYNPAKVFEVLPDGQSQYMKSSLVLDRIDKKRQWGRQKSGITKSRFF
jgi:hypothetical protein